MNHVDQHARTPSPPSAPGTLTATGGLGQIALSWGAATDNVGVAATTSTAARRPASRPRPANRIAQPTGTSYTDTGLAAGTYYYRVTAEDAAGNVGPAGNEASATATADTTPPTVSITAPGRRRDRLRHDDRHRERVATTCAVAGVQFKLDGANLGAEDTTAPYSDRLGHVRERQRPAHADRGRARRRRQHDDLGRRRASPSRTPAPSAWSARYGFDEGSGTTTADQSGNGNTGTVSGATWSPAGSSATRSRSTARTTRSPSPTPRRST